MLTELFSPTPELVGLRRAAGVSFLRIDAVVSRTGLSRSSVYAMAAEGKFPKPIRLAGTRVAVWASDSIDTWIAAQLSGSAAEVA